MSLFWVLIAWFETYSNRCKFEFHLFSAAPDLHTYLHTYWLSNQNVTYSSNLVYYSKRLFTSKYERVSR